MLQISDVEFHTITMMVKTAYGIDLGKKRALIEGRLCNYLQDKGLNSFHEYIHQVHENPSEMSEMLNRLTTNHTYFMREPEHFQHFSQKVLPEIARLAKDRDIRVWSAGCSSGQEPYTLFMLMDEFFSNMAGKWDHQVLATDISERALMKAIEGTYDAEELIDLPEAWKRKYFINDHKGHMHACSGLKDGVTFRKFNLMEKSFPFRKQFHVIYCRNVMIYFDMDTKVNLIQRYCDNTEVGGYLYIGQTETVPKGNYGYRYVQPAVYRREH